MEDCSDPAVTVRASIDGNVENMLIWSGDFRVAL
jgi:hypothetical protein